MRKPRIICLLGPTGSGKTDLALALAERFPVEIISVDSAMVYRGMNIGTSKPSAEVRSKIPHRLIDICDPDEVYSAGRFCKEAKFAIHDILAKGKTPLLVGGTLLYFKALLQGICELPVASPSIRLALQDTAFEKGLGFLHERLKVVDPIAAARIHPHDKQRIERALEVYEQTGKPLTEFIKQGWQATSFPYDVLQLALIPVDRSRLYLRIERRFLDMLKRGLVDEVRKLRNNTNLTLNAPSMRAVGYRQVWLYLNKQIDEAKMQEEAITATRHLAKRQITWLNSWQGLLHFESEDPNLLKLIKDEIERVFENVQV